MLARTARNTSIYQGTDSPADLADAFVGAINVGDLDAAVRCFARDGCLLTPDATTVRGRDEIRGVLMQLVQSAWQIEVQGRSAVKTGDVALLGETWDVSARGAFLHRTRPLLVAQRLEGAWKLAIASPWARDGR